MERWRIDRGRGRRGNRWRGSPRGIRTVHPSANRANVSSMSCSASLSTAREMERVNVNGWVTGESMHLNMRPARRKVACSIAPSGPRPIAIDRAAQCWNSRRSTCRSELAASARSSNISNGVMVDGIHNCLSQSPGRAALFEGLLGHASPLSSFAVWAESWVKDVDRVPFAPPLRESSPDGVNGTPHPGRSLQPGSLL